MAAPRARRHRRRRARLRDVAHHRSTAPSDGAPLGTRYSAADELLAHRRRPARRRPGRDPADLRRLPDARRATSPSDELDLIARARRARPGRPLSFTVQQPEHRPRPVAGDARPSSAECAADGLRREGPGGAAARSACCWASTATDQPAHAVPDASSEVAGLPLRRAGARALARPRAAAAASSPSTTVATLPEGIARRARRAASTSMFPLTDPVDYELDVGRLDRRRRRGRRADAPAEVVLRPAARARRPPAALHAAVQLRRRQPRRRPRDADCRRTPCSACPTPAPTAARSATPAFTTSTLAAVGPRPHARRDSCRSS